MFIMFSFVMVSLTNPDVVLDIVIDFSTAWLSEQIVDSKLSTLTDSSAAHAEKYIYFI